MDTARQGYLARGRRALGAAYEAWKLSVQRTYASVAHRAFSVRARFGGFIDRHRAGATVAVLAVTAFAVWQMRGAVQEIAEPSFRSTERLADLRSWLIQLGAALVGAVAIVASLVLFAMQVNIERMPHGLFRRLSSDIRLMGAFAGAFGLAVAVGAMGLAVESHRLGLVLIAAVSAIGTVLLLFLFAYRRALTLVNPLRQLDLLVLAAARDLNKWQRRARRAKPLLQPASSEPSPERSRFESDHDMARVLFFRANPGWTNEAERQVKHAASFARRYSEQGDYEVSRTALGAIVAINTHYIEAKGKTFFSHPGIIDNPLATDGFINETLELLRQHVKVGITRGDEEHIEQGFQAFAALVRAYLGINYSLGIASKTHAKLAAGYLADAVTSVLPHDMPDVLMEGVRRIQGCGTLFVALADPNDVVLLTDKLSTIGVVCTTRNNLQPVVSLCVQTFADLTFALIALKRRTTRFALKNVLQHMQYVAKMFLKVPDTPFQSTHGTYLGAYYSLTASDSLADKLTQLVNVIGQAKEDDKDAVAVLGHLEEWSADLHQCVKELFVEAVNAHSFLAHHIIQWVPHITKILLVASQAPACRDHTRKELERNALWLISQLSWVPDDNKAVAFVENFQLTEVFAEAALDARERSFPEISDRVAELLLSWIFKAGTRDRGWGTLERGLCGAAALAVLAGDAQEAMLVENVKKRMVSKDAPSNELRARVAGDLHERTEEGYRDYYRHSVIDQAMMRVNPERLRALFTKLIEVVAPQG